MVEQVELKLKSGAYSFTTDILNYHSVEAKGEKKHYVTGYISTKDRDIYDDIVTEKGLNSMLEQINNSTVTLDYEHEAHRDDNTIIPVGKIVEARIDEKGLWVKAELNKHSPKFKSMWDSIKDGFVNAFSIAFKPVKAITKHIGDAQVRLIDELELVNVAFTGCPVNPNAKITGHNMKSVMLKAISDMEAISLTEEKKIENKDEAPASEAEAPKEEAQPEAPAEEKKEEAPAEESKADEDVEQKAQMEEMTKQLKAMADEQEKLKKELKDVKEAPVFKSKAPEQPEKKTVEAKGVIDAIR